MNREELVEKIKEVLSRYSEEKKPGAKAVIVTIPDTAEFTGDLTAIQLRDIVFRRMMEEDRPCNVISGSGEGEVLTFGIVKKMRDGSYLTILLN